jgi:MerR family transcriptional regulator, thiopeptide resistance regulator
MVYTVKKLAAIAGVSTRTLHYYDQIGLLKPGAHSRSGYRWYSEEEAARLQQIMFFRELGFGLTEIRDIMARPGYSVLEALESHRELLFLKAERLKTLLGTVENTIHKLKGEREMGIKDYYDGFSDQKIEEYRKEVRERWGENTLKDSEDRVLKMGKEKFQALQADGGKIFQAVAGLMDKKPESSTVQAEITRWREWLENFSHYSDEAVLGLGRAYSQDPHFAAFFKKFGDGMPEFFTRAVEYYAKKNSKE